MRADSSLLMTDGATEYKDMKRVIRRSVINHSQHSRAYSGFYVAAACASYIERWISDRFIPFLAATIS